MKICYASIGRVKGKYTALDPYPRNSHTRPTVTADWVLGPALLGKEITWPAPYDWKANPKLRTWAEDWFLSAQKLLDDRHLKPHPHRVSDEGFDGVIKGLKTLSQKGVSGTKLVYRVP